jgi:serine phosphatase RsbU (regulator of sigma subunit)
MIRVFDRTSFVYGRGATGGAFVSGEPFLINNYAEFPDRVPDLAEVTGSLMSVPMKIKNRVIGVFDLVSLQTGAFTDEDLSLAMGIADLAAVAIENARLYERQRNIAETFQRSFLPAELPVVPGLELAIRYRAALMEAEVGGDFYDAFRLDDDKVGILVADVSGKGLSAAVYTAMGKYMIRAYSMENLSPSLVLEKFNKAFAKHAPSGMFVTMFYAVLDGGTHTLTFSNAGQEQPMFYSKRLGALDKLEVSGPGLGAALEAGYAERTIVLEPGDMGLVYTDGATDVRRGGEFFGFERLESLFRANLDGSADEAAEAMLRAVFEYGEGRLSDDVAILVLKRPQ